ncbi:MAG: hypothetical protein NZ700_10655 [Gemmataceae bacterium]|nr:hypothetical protein [Gemmataceae bacterium]MDW8264449.1 hypothetical protein [Gemmataceae bacterium]
MWMTLALATAMSLAPEQAGSLRLTNVRATYGMQGPIRTDNKILPGDAYFVAFDMENVRVDPMGRVLYTMGMEVIDAKSGKVLFKQDPRDLEALNSLGGTTVPAFAHVTVGLDHPPGQFKLRVTVTDRVAKATQTLEQPFEVLKPDFGLVRLQLSAFSTDQTPERFSMPPIGAPGQIVWVNFALVGFGLDSNKKPNLAVEMTIVDAETGKPTLSEPFRGAANQDIPENFRAVPMAFFVALNRPGKYTIRLKATDLISRKTSELSFPFTVYKVPAK